jgi:hypothetical protein
MAQQERRLEIRDRTPIDVIIVGREGRDDERACLMLDHSDGGARLQMQGSFEPPNLFLLRIASSQSLRLAQVRWRRDGQIGIEFVEPETMSAKLECLHAQVETLELRMNDLRAFVERQMAGGRGAEA